MKRFLTLAEYERVPDLNALDAMRLNISYTDSTHLKQDEWLSLLDVEYESRSSGSTLGEADRFYTLSPAVATTIGGGKPVDSHLVRDLLALSLSRAGLLLPHISDELHVELSRLARQGGIVLLPDSNALYNGSLHWLLRIFRNSTVWVLPFVVSLTQIQEKDAGLKNLVNKRDARNMRTALRSRAFINSALSLLQRHRSHYQVLELDPSLLRYMRWTGKDADEGNVLEDRLLIEGIHAVLRAMRTRAEQKVVTSDVLLARVLEAEGLPCLFMPPPTLPTAPMECVNYSTLVGDFTGAPLRHVLWELTHSFSEVRLRDEEVEVVGLAAYWPAKAPTDWKAERLLVSHGDGSQGARAVDPDVASGPVGGPVDPGPLAEAVERPGEVRTEREAVGAEDVGLDAVPQEVALSRAFLPEASLTLVLQLAGALLNQKPGSVGEVLARMSTQDRPVEKYARRGLEIIRRVGVATSDGTHVSPTPVCHRLDTLLQESKLDEMSALFERFIPYKVLLDALRRDGRVSRGNVGQLFRDQSGDDVAKNASARLLRYPTLLGQAWTSGDDLLDGTQRPSPEDFRGSFASTYRHIAEDGLAKVSELLPALCRRLRMTPWAVNKRVTTLAEAGDLPDFTFQPAAGRKPVLGDRVVSGRLDLVTETTVYLDRFEVGGRPVFTIGGPV